MTEKFSREFLIELNRLMDRHDVVIREISYEDSINDLFNLNLKQGEKKFYFVNEENEFIVDVNDTLKLVSPRTPRFSFRKNRFYTDLNRLLIKYNLSINQEDMRDELSYP